VPRIRLGTTDPGQTTPVFRPEAIGQNDSKTEIGPKSRFDPICDVGFCFSTTRDFARSHHAVGSKIHEGGSTTRKFIGILIWSNEVVNQKPVQQKPVRTPTV